MKYLSRFSFALVTVMAAACSDDASPQLTADDFVAPTTAAEVEDLYARLGTCNDSFLTRSLTPRAELQSSTIWNAPTNARAGLLAWREPTGWGSLLLANELTFTNVGEDVTTPDPACAAVQRLLTPYRAAGSERDQFAHVLLYLDEAEHPYASYPDAGIEARRASAPAALVSYLDVIYAVREVATSGNVTYRDVTEQHVPLYVSCTRAFEVETTTAILDEAQLAQIDPEMCDEGTDLGGDGNLFYRCVAERGRHVADNKCTFVADASKLETLDGERRPVLFGGTITSRGEGDALAYEITVDRFSR